MGNFYGGKEGRSFVIVKEYKTIAEMVTNFQKGPAYTEVNFDEYVLINTINKNNPENGQVFRRGYDFDSDRTILSYNLDETVENDETKTYLNLELPAGGAIYIGTIVGPAGRAPIFNLEQYDTVIDKNVVVESSALDVPEDMEIETVDNVKVFLNTYYSNGVKTTNEAGEEIYARNVRYVLNENGFNYYHYFHLDEMLYAGNIDASIGWYEVDTPPVTGRDSFLPGDNLVPGVSYKYENGQIQYELGADGRKHMQIESHQDTIDWAYCSIRNENNEDSTAYVGFRIASPVVEYEAESVDAYYNRNDILNEDGTVSATATKTNVFENLNLVTREQTEDEIKSHPFYSKWKISIPKGIKGESIKNVRVITANDSVVAFDVDNNGNLRYDEYGKIITKAYDGRADDIEHSRKIIVYDYYYYDRVKEGDHFIIYLGDFNKIDDITFGNDGTITFDYSHDDNTVYTKLVDWITDMAFEENGTVTVTFNNDTLFSGKLTKTNLITWITSFDLNEEGTLTVKFNNNRLVQNISKEKFITWIQDFTFDSDTGAFNMTFNNDNFTPVNHTFNYVKAIERDNDSNSKNFNHLLILHSDPEKQGNITHNGIAGWEDLGGLGYIMAHADDGSTTLTDKQNALSVGGVWFVTETAPEGDDF